MQTSPTPATTRPSRHRYPSDLTQNQWEIVAPLCVLEERSSRGRPRSSSLRDVIDALNYRWTTGCSWRMLPHDYPAWQTVYWYFRQWQRTGQLRTLREALQRRRNPWPVAPDHPWKPPAETASSER